MGARLKLSERDELLPALLSGTRRTCPRDEAVHVLTLTPFYPMEGDEGAGCFIAEPLRALENCGVKNTVVFAAPFYRPQREVSRAALPATAVRYFSVPKGIGLASAGVFLFSRIVNLVRDVNAGHRIDLLHAHGALPCGHAAALLCRELGIPFVVTVHGLDAYSTNQVKGIPGRWAERVSRMVYTSARRVICISDRVREEVQIGGSISTEIAYNGVDTELFCPVPECDGDPVILSIGDLIPIKGHDQLLRALPELSRKFPALKCQIIGHGPQRDALDKLAADLQIAKRVSFEGRVTRSEVAEKLRRCTIFVLPSSYEALGCVYLEAMATAKPVVACWGQGIGEIIRNGENGILVEPGNVPQLISALSMLLADSGQRRRIASAGHRTVHQNLTLAHQAEKLARIYAECAR